MPLDRFNKKFPAIIAALKNARVNRRMAHAYLLYSDSPDLRQEFAIELSKLTSCTHSETDGTPCDICKVCRQLENRSYAELYTLEPTSKSRIIPVGEDENDPDSIRWFEHQFFMTSTSESGKKIGIIQDADRMNEKAQNAFLKTLEEPPPNTYFILATANPSALLPTIRSRCQPLIMLENQCKYDFEGSDELFMALHELFFASGNLTKAENCASNIIGIANGLQQKAGEDTDEKWSEKLETAKTLESPARKQIEKRHQAAANAEYLQSRSYFLSAIHTWFAQIYQLASGVPSSNLANPEILLSAPPDNIDEEKAFKALDRTGKLLQNLRWSINEELAIREFCLNIALDN